MEAGGSQVSLPEGSLGVVGAGTMGSGIVQVAVAGGMQVKLYDPIEGAAEKAVSRIEGFLVRAVERGRMKQDDAIAAVGRIHAVEDLQEFIDCFMVVEAAPEKLEIKQQLFGELAGICGSQVVFATNTSSIPVTAIASGIANEERVVGMHFFNPVPLMRLVEVIAGMNSGNLALQITREVAKRMGRDPIDATDGPGFLVNRCSRPFLLEAQKLLQERVADHATIDKIARLGGGFKMGPFELSDLVGVDVGFDIAKSFYELGFNEPRWQPSAIPARMIAAGRLGRKSRHGYYTYNENGDYRAPDPPTQMPDNPIGTVEILGTTSIADQIRRLAQAAGYTIAVEGDGNDSARALIVDARLALVGEGINLQAGPLAVLCAASSLAAVARGRDVVGFHALPPLGESHLIELTRGSGTTEATGATVAHFFRSIGKHVQWVGDAPGLVLGRIVCQLINEAAFALQDGVGSAADIDKGVQVGLSYPRGLLAWADLIGVEQVLATIDALQREIGGDRYRAAPLLRRMTAEGRTGRAGGAGFYRY